MLVGFAFQRDVVINERQHQQRLRKILTSRNNNAITQACLFCTALLSAFYVNQHGVRPRSSYTARSFAASAATNKIFKTSPCPSASWQGYFDVSGAVIESGGERHGDCTITVGPSAEQHLTEADTQRMMLRFEILDIQSCVDRLIMYDDKRREESSRIAELTCGNEAEHLGFFYTRSSYLTLRYFTYNINGRRPSQFRLIITAVNQKLTDGNGQHYRQQKHHDFSQRDFARPTTAENNMNNTGFCNSSSKTDFYCQNRHCISRDLVCDDIDHCGDQSDEAYCSSAGTMHGGNGASFHRASAMATYRLIGIGIALVLCVILSMGGFCMLVCRESAPFRPQLGVGPTDPAVRASICATRTASLTNFQHNIAHAATARRTTLMSPAASESSSGALACSLSPATYTVQKMLEADAARQRALDLERQVVTPCVTNATKIRLISDANEAQELLTQRDQHHQHIDINVNVRQYNELRRHFGEDAEAAQDREQFKQFLRFYAAISAAEEEEEEKEETDQSREDKRVEKLLRNLPCKDNAALVDDRSGEPPVCTVNYSVV